MPYSILTTKPTKTRVLIVGPPNSGKTTSFMSVITEELSEDDNEAHIITIPGEKGTKSLPMGKGVFNYVFESPEKPPNAILYARQTRKELLEIIQTINVNPHCKILILDGLHKVYGWYMDEVTGGLYGEGDDFDAKRYGQAHQMMYRLLDTIYTSPIPLVIGTIWDKWDTPPGRDSNPSRDAKRIVAEAPRYLYPNLPGQMSAAMLGEWDAVVHAHLEKKCSDKKCTVKGEHFIWQLVSGGVVRGVGLKGKEVGSYPQFIHQEWGLLKQFMEDI